MVGFLLVLEQGPALLSVYSCKAGEKCDNAAFSVSVWTSVDHRHISLLNGRTHVASGGEKTD